MKRHILGRRAARKSATLAAGTAKMLSRMHQSVDANIPLAIDSGRNRCEAKRMRKRATMLSNSRGSYDKE